MLVRPNEEDLVIKKNIIRNTFFSKSLSKHYEYERKTEDKTFCLVCFSTINICNAYSPLFKVINLTQVAMFYTGTVLVKYVCA